MIETEYFKNVFISKNLEVIKAFRCKHLLGRVLCVNLRSIVIYHVQRSLQGVGVEMVWVIIAIK